MISFDTSTDFGFGFRLERWVDLGVPEIDSPNPLLEVLCHSIAGDLNRRECCLAIPTLGLKI
jgi:hypothetical protein